ncbi:hypothetical protein LZQ00_08235 [Sphingobacterium sp. SRCM116780]|uniref:hypothetical protein n=1 Tax=Sphingobacterium sp. SRCM116780 TaxID=2907623 RepID=UPI001F1DCAF6|nr:hypothetical protein [Sphingobacterium sp. SRCM116780]UIR57795.1 hypothetical protein LZQ00_08235 [Sphingobacterium sp. SRCM116780]
MKNYIIFFLFSFLIPVFASGQKLDSIDFTKKMRIQGYLIIEGNHEVLKEGSDIPRKFLFIPIEKLKNENFSSIYKQEKEPSHTDLFIPTSFLEKMKVIELNAFLKLALQSPLRLKIEEIVNDCFENSLRNNGTFYRLKDSTKELSIIFIDGIWGKVSVPSKYLSRSNIEGYNMSRLKVNETLYDYYYLLETKSFSYLNYINDRSLIKIE